MFAHQCLHKSARKKQESLLNYTGAVKKRGKDQTGLIFRPVALATRVDTVHHLGGFGAGGGGG